jgi:hypothetical protein
LLDCRSMTPAARHAPPSIERAESPAGCLFSAPVITRHYPSAQPLAWSAGSRRWRELHATSLQHPSQNSYGFMSQPLCSLRERS